MITEEQKVKAMKTYRGKGAVGGNALVPRYLYKNFLSSCRNQKVSWNILDYGCGKDQNHVKLLHEQGYRNAYGYDFSLPETKQNLELQYDIVYASNVLNVQDSPEMLEATLKEIASVLKEKGLFIANYPKSPRKCDLDNWQVYTIVGKYFKNTVGTKKTSGLLIICRK